MKQDLSPELQGVDSLLRRASASIAYPPAPPIAGHVAARLRAGRDPWYARVIDAWRSAFAHPAARVAAAGLGAVLLVIATALAVPQSRDALADFFGLGSVRVSVGSLEGPRPPVLSPDAFARPVSLATARDAVDFQLRLPAPDGAALRPDAVYLQDQFGQWPAVILVYEHEGYDLYQSRNVFFGKGVPQADLVQEFEFDGHSALWFTVGGHVASFLDEEGRVMVETERTVERATLFWEEDGINYRLETSLSQDEAVDLARSLR